MLNPKKSLRMAVIEGVLKEIKISEEQDSKQGKYFQYDIGYRWNLCQDLNEY